MSFKVTRSVPKGSAKAKKIASSISVVDATGSVTYTDLDGNVSSVYVSAGVGHTAIAATAKYVSILPSSVTLGFYLLRHEDFDFATLADIINVTYSKNIFDEVSVVGDKTIFYNLKAPSDFGVVTDTPSLNLAKDFEETFEVTDLYSYRVSFVRKPQEVVDASELVEKETTKAFTEANNIDDSIDKLDFGKGITELPQAIDAPSIGIEKPTVTDSASFISLDPTFAYNKKPDDVASYTDDLRYDLGYHLNDNINATDDYMGESNVDDDQTMHFGKTRIDNGSASELFSRVITYDRQFSDAYNGQDSASLGPSKHLTDTTSVIESLVRQVDYVRTLNEIGLSSEDIAFASSIVLQDNSSASELFSRAVDYNREFSELSSSQDSVDLAYTKLSQDAISVETLFYRQVSFNRDFYDLANPSDNISLFASRVLQDNGTATENAVKSSGKINNDSASFTDSGKLFWQGYVEDPTYFADDYVGNSQNF